MNMNTVEIDVSKRKSIANLRPRRKVVAKFFEVTHLSGDIHVLVDQNKSLEGDSRIITECTGCYYEPPMNLQLIFSKTYYVLLVAIHHHYYHNKIYVYVDLHDLPFHDYTNEFHIKEHHIHLLKAMFHL